MAKKPIPIEKHHRQPGNMPGPRGAPALPAGSDILPDPLRRAWACARHCPCSRHWQPGNMPGPRGASASCRLGPTSCRTLCEEHGPAFAVLGRFIAETRAFNFEHPTSNRREDEQQRAAPIFCSTFGVRCWMFGVRIILRHGRRSEGRGTAHAQDCFSVPLSVIPYRNELQNSARSVSRP